MPVKHTPTPEQIRIATAEIRKDWDDKTHHKRGGKLYGEWDVPTVTLVDRDWYHTVGPE